MGSRFSFYYSKYFADQWQGYDRRAKELIRKKLELIKENPFRFEKHEGYRFVFKVKLTIKDKYSRLMYAVFMPDSEHITILGIFPRDANYKDFERIFFRLRKR